MNNYQGQANHLMLNRNSEIDLLIWLRRHWRQDTTRTKWINKAWDRREQRWVIW